MAQQRQDRRGEVQAATASATGLACFIFRFLRRPQALFHARLTTEEIGGYLMKKSGRWLNDAPDIQLVYAI
ncbi:hypothetical protein AAGI29_28845, partial [Klebsiella pneumoniae]